MMAYTLSHVSSSTTPRDGGLRRSFSNKDLHRRGMMRRSYSDNHLCHSITSMKGPIVKPKLKNSRSVGFFNMQLSDTLKSFLFDPETSNAEENDEDEDEDEVDMNEVNKRSNWIDRLMELRSNWKGKEEKVDTSDDGEGCDGEGGCEVEYEEDGDNHISIDRETFSSLLTRVSWSDTKLFSQLAFLCNMAYVIADMKVHFYH